MHLHSSGQFKALMRGTAQQYIKVGDIADIRLEDSEGFSYKLKHLAELRKDEREFEEEDIVIQRIGTGNTVGKVWYVD